MNRVATEINDAHKNFVPYARLCHTIPMSTLQYYITLIIVADLWLWLDLATKHWASNTNNLPWGNTEGLFYLSEVTLNSGIAFGWPVPRWIQIVATILILGFLIYTGHDWLKKNEKRFLQALIFGLVIGGALGNFWERITRGAVVDFIVLWPFPNFNLADVGITVGLLALIILGWRIEKNEK